MYPELIIARLIVGVNDFTVDAEIAVGLVRICRLDDEDS